MSAPPRDRWSRPLIVPPEGGKAKAYTRATTLASTLDDTFKLGQWQQRMVAIGLMSRQDLQLAVQAADPTDRNTLNQICDQAKEAAGASTSATTGTALHSLTEYLDKGEELPPGLSESVLRDLEAYRLVTAGMEVAAIETFVVVDELEVAGTFDRLVKIGNKHFIADIKTGSVEYGMDKIETQLAIYAHGQRYDHPGQREELPNVDQKTGIVIHLPAGTGTCALYKANLERGWEGAKIAKAAREWRGKRRLVAADLLGKAIESVSSLDELSTLYRSTPDGVWKDKHTDLATQRKKQLEEAA